MPAMHSDMYTISTKKKRTLNYHHHHHHMKCQFPQTDTIYAERSTLDILQSSFIGN